MPARDRLSVVWVCVCRLPTHIASLTVMGDRIYVADSQESVFFMKYKKAENQLYIYADDTTSRYLTTQLQLDYDTLCGADKFGNIFMMRLPADLSQQVTGWQLPHTSSSSYASMCMTNTLHSTVLSSSIRRDSSPSLVAGKVCFRQ